MWASCDLCFLQAFLQGNISRMAMGAAIKNFSNLNSKGLLIAEPKVYLYFQALSQLIRTQGG